MAELSLERLFWLDGQLLTLHRLLSFDPPAGQVPLVAQTLNWAEMPVVGSRSDEVLHLSWGHSSGSQALRLEAQQTGHGPRLRLICPITQRGTQDLYFNGVIFASARGLTLKARAVESALHIRKLQRAHRRLFGRDGKRAAQGQLRKQYTDELSYNMDQLNLQARSDIDGMFKVRKVKGADVPVRRIRNFSTDSGLNIAEDTAEFVYQIPHNAGANLDMEERPPLPTLRPPSRVDKSTKYCCIDMKVLAERGLVPVEGSRHFAFMWAPDGGPQYAYFCTLNITVPGGPGTLAIRAIGRSEPEWIQQLQVTPHNRWKRHSFLCPVMEDRTDELFLRDGRFASATGQLLVKVESKDDWD